MQVHERFYTPNLFVPAGQNVHFAPNTTYRGLGRDDTIYTCSFPYGAAGEPAFVLAPGSVIEDVTLSNPTNWDTQACNVGFGITAPGTQAAPNNGVARLRRVRIKYGTFGAYMWGGYGLRIIMEDVIIEDVPRWGICQGNSGGPDAGYFECYDVRMVCTTINPANGVACQHLGRQGPTQAMFVANGGQIIGQGCFARLVGDTSLTRQAMAWTPAAGEAFGNIDLWGCASELSIAGAGAPPPISGGSMPVPNPPAVNPLYFDLLGETGKIVSHGYPSLTEQGNVVKL